MKLTKAENHFFYLIESGHKVNNKTTALAGCGRAFSTIVRKYEDVTEDGYYNGVSPIPMERRIELKRIVHQYHKDHSKKNYIQPDKPQPKRGLSDFTTVELMDELRQRMDKFQSLISQFS